MKKKLYISSLLCFSLSIFTSPSNLDTSFNNSGATNLFIAQALNQAENIKAQVDGKIVTVGFAGNNGIIVRYNNDGSIDNTFNANSSNAGYVVLTIGTQSALFGLAIQPTDGKILVAGYTIINNVEQALIARFNSNGTADTSFGLNANGYITSTFQSQCRLFDLALQSNGSFIVTGWALDNSGLSNALTARYTSAGILDPTFNANGYVKTLIGSIFTRAQALTIQTDGKIVITGQAEIDGNQGLIVIRYNNNGTIDTAFGTGGYVFPFSGFVASRGTGITLQNDQKIIVVGSSNPSTAGFQNQYYTILRFNTDGSLDQTFNATDTPGAVISSIGYIAFGVIVQSNNQIVTCGFNYQTNYIMIVACYNSDGSFDETFNFTPTNIINTIANALTIQLDGKILVAGTVTKPSQQ